MKIRVVERHTEALDARNYAPHSWQPGVLGSRARGVNPRARGVNPKPDPRFETQRPSTKTLRAQELRSAIDASENEEICFQAWLSKCTAKHGSCFGCGYTIRAKLRDRVPRAKTWAPTVADHTGGKQVHHGGSKQRSSCK